MIKKVRIRNYKCYGDQPADFELAHINFIYGDNSVGKSTFLQCLDFIYHMYDGGNVSIPANEEFDGRSFKRVGADKIDIWIRTGDDVVWQGKVIDGQFALRNDAGEIVKKTDYFLAVPWLRHSEAPRPKRNRESDAFEKLKGSLIDAGSIEAINRMFERLGVGYKCIDVMTLEDSVLGFPGIPVVDVGTGIAVMFDVLQSIAAWQKGILLLEEPEANVNEGQLKALTGVLVEEAKKRFESDSQLVIECHSEHILRALMSLVSQGVISSEDVAIFYVTKTSDGSVVKLCQMDENGTLDQWPDPKGFFTARRRILFGDDE